MVGINRAGFRMLIVCPLCGSDSNILFHEDKIRRYRRCSSCALVFVEPQFHLSPADEKVEYDLHENDVNDPGYRRFLSRLLHPMLNRLEPESLGLDFGCGPAPALASMFAEHGQKMRVYDPFYAPDTSVLQDQYDFITASEVVEHLHHPATDFAQLFAHLKPGGVFGIMTKLVISQQAFANWHYIRDRTHVCFYSEPTFAWLADQYHTGFEQIGSDVIILQ